MMRLHSRKLLLPGLLSLCFLAPGAFAGGNTGVKNFRAAIRIAAKLHAENPLTIYCGCRYEGKLVDIGSCGYRPRRGGKKAATQLNWEHVVPAENFGRSFVEWREGVPACRRKGKMRKGRKCAERNPEFNHMEGDLYNLWPEIAELNQLRKNFNMAALGGAVGNAAYDSFGGCQAVIKDRKFEPMDRAKGIVARTYMYMDQAYPGRGIISDKNEKLFELWDKQFPVTSWECKLAKKIRAAQGNENPVLQSRCAVLDKKTP
jgi:deoxyribonuclease-1